MRLRWEAGQPARTAAWLSETLDLPLAALPDALEIAFSNAVLEFTPISGPERPSGDGRLQVVDEAPALGSGGSPSALLSLAAVGIATVDTERYAGDAHWTIGRLPADEVLGASCALVAGQWLLLLEPNREGRIAASLARLGEGPAAIYLSTGGDGGPAAVHAAMQKRGVALTSLSGGPFGSQFAIAAGPAWGPHVVVCQREEAGRAYDRLR